MTPIEAYKILFRHYRNVLLYGTIGVSALGLEVFLFFMLSQVAHVNIMISNAGAMLAGFFMSFTLNSLYNFGVRDRLLARLLRFGVVTFFGYWLATGIIMILVSYAHVPAMIAKAISIPAFFAFQYTLNKKFTFQRTPGNALSAASNN